MRNPSWLLASAFLLTAGVVRAQDPLPEGAEIQARGPVHEAFAQPLDNDRPESNPTIEKQPPDPIEELPPDQKPEGDNVMWIPGYWQWDEDRGDFLWVSGVWRAVPPERKWVPGHWRRTDDGNQWVNGYWTSTEVTEQQYLPPPPERVETAAPEAAPGDDYFYVPGCWVWRDTRYVWRTGYWLRHRPGWVWQPACYYWSPAGYVFCDGYWDYPFERRGCLFAPVYFANRHFHHGWFWTPRYCVSPSFLTVALFVRPSYRHYYFGDYDGHRYAKSGYTPWIDYRIGRGAYDPLYSYYRTAYRDRNWEKDVRNVYVARREGKLDSPPRTLNQQERVLHNLGVRKNGDATVVRNTTALASLTEVAKRNEIKLASLGREERDRQVKQATQIRSAARERVKVEQELIQRKEAPLTPKAQPKAVKLPSVPSVAARTAPDVKPPPKPEREAKQPPAVTPQDRPRPPEDRPKPPEDKPKPPPTERPKPPEDKPKPPPQDRPKPPEDRPKPPEDRPKPPPTERPKPPPTERPKPPEDKPKPPPQDRPKPPPTERPKPPDDKPRVPPPPPVKDPPREVPRERPRVDPPQSKVPPPAPKPEVKPVPPPREAPREVPRERPRVEPPRAKVQPPAPRLQAPVQAKPAPRVAPQPKVQPPAPRVAPQPRQSQPKAPPSKPQGKPNRPRGR